MAATNRMAAATRDGARPSSEEDDGKDDLAIILAVNIEKSEGARKSAL